ncbi:MAG: ABC transporter ATP-binding protein [Thermotogae bacterium]|nr:ABC transporter ATP-binding protein [Thermotogota bacterium]
MMKWRLMFATAILLHLLSLLVIPIFYKRLIDIIIYDKIFIKALLFAGGIMLAAVGSSTFEHLGNYLRAKLHLEMAEKNIIRSMEEFYRLDVKRAREEGRYLNLIFNTSMNMASKEVEFFHKLLNALFGGIFMVAVGMYLSHRMFILSIIIFLSAFSVVNYLSRYIGETKKREMDERLRFKNRLIDVLKSFKLWRIIGLQRSYIIKPFEKFKTKYLKFEAALSIISNISWFLYQGVYVVIILIGGYMVLRGGLSISSLLAMVYLVRKYGDIFSDITSLIPVYREIQVYRNKLREGLSPLREYRIFKDYIECEGIYASYGEKEVLKNLHFVAKNSDRVLITGPNGSGKTTLAHIISGNLEPLKGKVITPRNLSSLILPVHLPPARVKDMVDPETLKRYGLDSVKENLCTELSIGQKRVVGILLALSKKADAYIFDEPLESLDEIMSREISALILSRTSNGILIIIQHMKRGNFGNFREVRIA